MQIGNLQIGVRCMPFHLPCVLNNTLDTYKTVTIFKSKYYIDSNILYSMKVSKQVNDCIIDMYAGRKNNKLKFIIAITNIGDEVFHDESAMSS